MDYEDQTRRVGSYEAIRLLTEVAECDSEIFGETADMLDVPDALTYYEVRLFAATARYLAMRSENSSLLRREHVADAKTRRVVGAIGQYTVAKDDYFSAMNTSTYLLRECGYRGVVGGLKLRRKAIQGIRRRLEDVDNFVQHIESQAD